jgi:DNA-binding NarL/FixJ family response regulator
MPISKNMATPMQIAQIVKFRALGWSQQEIADEVDLSRQAVAYQLQRLKRESKKKNADDVFSTALLGGLVGAAGGFAIALLLDELTKKK